MAVLSVVDLYRRAAAADLFPLRKSVGLFGLWKFFLQRGQFDELCFEFFNWIHIARDKGNATPRRMVKVFTRVDGRKKKVDLDLDEARGLTQAAFNRRFK